MKYGVVFLLVVAIALLEIFLLGGWAWLLAWPALAFAWVAAGYLGLGPRVFSKRRDGSIAPVALVAIFPFFGFLWMLWHLHRLISKEPAYNEIVPGLWLGRRLLPYEMPEGCQRVIDLTAEFIEPAGVRVGRDYQPLPTLDTQAPPFGALTELAMHVARTPETTLVHCASGHGRSALFMACVLLARGLANNPDEAVALLGTKRPRIGLSGPQRATLNEFARRLTPP